MFSGDVSFGFGCPRCKTFTSVAVGGGEYCNTCGTKLVPVRDAPPMHAGFVCQKCGYSVGLGVGFDHCPGCNAPIP